MTQSNHSASKKQTAKISAQIRRALSLARFIFLADLVLDIVTVVIAEGRANQDTRELAYSVAPIADDGHRIPSMTSIDPSIQVAMRDLGSTLGEETSMR